MNSQKPSFYATDKAMEYVSDLDVDTDAFLLATDTLGYTQEQLDSLTVTFTMPPFSVKRLLTGFIMRNEAISVGSLSHTADDISIYPGNVAKIIAKGWDPLAKTDWSGTAIIANQLVNHALAKGVYLHKEFKTIPEIFVPEVTAKTIDVLPIDSPTSGYALGALAAFKNKQSARDTEHKRIIALQRTVAEQRANHFADSFRASQIFGKIINLELK